MSEIRISSFDPIYDESSKILILGTMPSVASLEAGMYYSHPRNAFWKILKDLTGDDPGTVNDEKRKFLLRHGIALWDTLSSCEREGSLDGNIKYEHPNNVPKLVKLCPDISIIFLNGGAALKYYKRYHESIINLSFKILPSTSPANARGGYEKKLAAWHIVSDYLK
ncbi:MAG TPA: DNA-deoxyinosine glycosylase [Ruminiclostridium sp.]|nr:DNA-deoxyinosine glycosylase [Ruminiclostridium sp.]